MPDTFTIVLPGEAFEITDPTAFSPPVPDLSRCFPTMKQPLIYKQNPSKAQLRQGGYRGSLTLMKYVTRGGLRTELIIQASAPKLLYGNNLGEVSEEHFPLVCSAAVAMLNGMGTDSYRDAIAGATTNRMDYGKNLILPAGMISLRVIEELHRANTSERWTTNLTDYPNGGIGVSRSTKKRRLEAYDKRAELMGASPHRMRGAPDSFQGNLAPIDSTFPQILRIEDQLMSPKQIVAACKTIGAEPDRSFAALFSDAIERRVIEARFNEWISMLPAPVETQTMSEVIEALRSKNPTLTLPEASAQAVYITLAREKGVRGSRLWLKAQGMTENQIQYRQKTLLPFACSGSGEGILSACRDQIHAWELVTPASFPKLFDRKMAVASPSGLGRD